jgi:Ca2+-binding EF-hand superfamily protein
MLRNAKKVTESRLDHITDKDFEFFMKQTELSRKEVEDIFDIFHEKGGVLNKVQFRTAFKALNKNWLKNYEKCDAISDAIFRSFDKDSDGVLELKEFLVGCAVMFLSKGDKKVKLEYLFDFYDKNGDGYLNESELMNGYKTLFSMLGQDNIDNVCRDMAQQAFDEYICGSKISKDDFVRLLMENKTLHDRLSMLF